MHLQALDEAHEIHGTPSGLRGTIDEATSYQSRRPIGAPTWTSGVKSFGSSGHHQSGYGHSADIIRNLTDHQQLLWLSDFGGNCNGLRRNRVRLLQYVGYDIQSAYKGFDIH